MTILLLLLLGWLLAALFFTLLALRPACRSREQQLATEMERHGLDPAMAQLPYEGWRLQSHRNTALFARFYACGNKEKIMLLFHGYNAPWISLLKYLSLLQKQGWSVLMPDHQAQGESEGRYISYGALESEDGCLWLQELQRRYPEAELAVMGESMGAATALLLAQRCPQLSFCVADCPFADLERELGYMARKRYRIPSGLLLPLCKLWFRILTGRTMDQASPQRRIDRLKVPTLLIHGSEDRTVPVESSRQLAQQSSMITYWEAPGARHAGVISAYPKEYEQRLAQMEQEVRV